MIGKKINQLATELAPVSTDLTIIGDPTTGVSKKITLAQLGAIFSGAVSFYTNLAGFPATGDINVIYCAKDTQKLYLWSGSAYVEVFPSQALLDTYQLRSEKGVSNGYASLDSTGKVPISQLPSSIMEYKGTWNAATNTPTLANGTGDTGDVYICNVAGTVNFGAGPITFAVGDYVIYSGSIWQRSSGAVGTVTSVAVSRSGDALAITGSPITTSGTINLGFAGNSTQYINGAGNLVTFPGIINEAQNLITEVYNKTGATLTKGTVVYINGGQGNLPAVTKALATGDSTSAQTYGIVRNDITNNNNGYVVVAGRISDLDTQAYTEGTQLYLSPTTAGAYTSTKPYAPQHLVYVGIVVRAHPTQGVVEVKIQNGYELDELHNVAAQTPTNNDGLFWESATSLWKNKSIATVLGYTPQPQLSGTGFVKISGTTISYDNSTYLTTSAAASTYLPLILNGSANTVDINGQQFTIQGSAGGFTSGRIIVDPVFSAIGYQNAGVFDGLKILTNGNAEFTNSGVTRFFNQVRFDSTLTNGTYTYTLPGATGTIALVGGAGVGTVTSVGLSSATSGVTIGSTPITTSGTITLAIATASGSQQGLLSSTDWTTFNNKQNALTNPVTGTGTTNYLPKFTGTSTIGNSLVYDNGTNVGIGTASPAATLDVNGTIYARSASGIFSDVLTAYSGGNLTLGYGASGSLIFNGGSGGATRMRLDASGNLGLGVTPSDWFVVYKALQIGSYGAAISGQTNDQALTLWNNAYPNASNVDTYTTTNAANKLRLEGGTYKFYTAPSGTAGNAISFTQAMTLDASGNLLVGGTSDSYITSSRKVLGITGTSEALISFRASGTAMGYIFAYASAIDISAIGRDFTVSAGTSSPTERFRIAASTGAATFSSSVRAGGDITYYNGGNLNAIITSGAADKGRMYIYNAGNPDIGFQAGGNSWFTNNVGIGTTSPDARLTVIDEVRVKTASTSGVGLSKDGSGAYLYNIDNTFMAFGTQNTERLRITSGGNVVMGNNAGSGWSTSSTRTTLEIYGGGFPMALHNSTSVGNSLSYNTYWDGSNWRYVGASSSAIYVQDSEGHKFLHNGSGTAGASFTPTERMRVTSTGNVGIGTTSPQERFDIAGLNGNIRIYGRSGIGENQIASNVYYNGSIWTRDNTSFGAASIILDSTNGQLLFNTTSATSGYPTERMRITSGGGLLINTTTDNGYKLDVSGQSIFTTTSSTTIAVRRNTTDGAVMAFYKDASVVGTISVTGSATAYNTSSDYRLKTDFKDFSGLDLVSKIKTYDYEWKSDKSRSYGVIAHELQSVINYAVTGVKDGEQMQGVDYSKIVPVLIKAIQELNDKIK